MSGTSGNNIIFGNGGDDLIAAGIGSLLAYGGVGNDTFVGHGWRRRGHLRRPGRGQHP